MVIRQPDIKGELYKKGRVIVPCHTTFNRRNNVLTEVAYSEDKSKVQVNQIVSKISNSIASNVPDCLMVDNEYELWNRRLNRWWGWNWQRKRKECMAKFGHQFGDFPEYNSQEDNVYNNQCPCQILCNKSNKEMNETMKKSVRETETQTLPKQFEYTPGITRVYNNQCPCQIRCNKSNKEMNETMMKSVRETETQTLPKQFEYTPGITRVYNNQCPCQVLCNKSNKEMNETMMKSVHETETQTLPKQFEYTRGFARVYRGRLKRNKQNNEYEGLLPEVSQNTDAKIKRKKRCLHIHLLNVHSNIFLNKNKTTIQTHTKSKNIIHRSDRDVTNSEIEINDTNVTMENDEPKFTSTRIGNNFHTKSTSCSNLSLIENSLTKSSENSSSTEQAIAEKLTLINSKIYTDPSEHDYNKLKEEHNELLSAVCEILGQNSDGVSTIFNKTNCECCPGDKMTQNTENSLDKENIQ